MPLRTGIVQGLAGAIADINKAYDLIDRLGYDPADPDFAQGVSIGNGTADAGPAFNACTLQAIADEVPVVPRAPAVAYQFSTPWQIPASEGFVANLGRWGSHLYRAASGLGNMIRFETSGSSHVSHAVFVGGTVDHQGNLQTSGSVFECPGAVHCLFVDVHVMRPWDVAYRFDAMGGGFFGHHNKVLWGLVDGGSSAATGANGGGIRWTSSDENWVVGTDFENMGGTGAKNQVLRDECGLQKVWFPNFVSAAGEAFRAQDCSHSQIVGLECDGVAGHNVVLVGSNHVVALCTCQMIGEAGAIVGGADGIRLDFNNTYCTVQTNTLEAAPTTGKTKSLIYETGFGTTPLNVITGNAVGGGGTPAQARIDVPAASLSDIHSNPGHDFGPNSQAGTTYTLQALDRLRPVEFTSASAVTVTVPANVFRVGDIVEVVRMGSGTVTLSAGTGMTLRTPATLAARVQYSTMTIRFRSATEAVVAGDTT